MKITKITIIPQNMDCERKDIEHIRKELIKKFTGKVYFETSGETIADCIIEKELKNKCK
jgi:Mor family transcriptional regulator